MFQDYSSSALSEHLKMFTERNAKTLHALMEWRALHYTGHFIDADPDMKSRIDEVNKRTENILKLWNIGSPETWTKPKRV